MAIWPKRLNQPEGREGWGGEGKGVGSGWGRGSIKQEGSGQEWSLVEFFCLCPYIFTGGELRDKVC